MRTKVLISDCREVVRAGLKVFLKSPRFDVVGETDQARGLPGLVRKLNPGVVVLGRLAAPAFVLGALSDLKAKHVDLRVLLIDKSDDATLAARAMALGASGYVAETCRRVDFVKAVDTAAAGRDAWTKPQREWLSGPIQIVCKLDWPLSPREREVLRQISFGLPNIEIAMALRISLETVKDHVKHILRKLKVPDRTRAGVWAVQQERASERLRPASSRRT